MNAPRLCFYGDDFTGSTDAMESLALAGVRTVVFTSVPTPQQLAQYRDLGAFGVAGMTRSMPPEEMERTLRPALGALRDLGTPIVHYKVCSTFDSSPTVGSIGRVIDVGSEIFQREFVPVLVGAPALGRYCVFGNLFARCGAESEPYRLDRHPSMSRHPVTPMSEADLRVHLAKQTNKRIALFDIVQLMSHHPEAQFRRWVESGPPIVLIDLLHESQLATAGRLLASYASESSPLFVVGSSGVESALVAHWGASPAKVAPLQPAGPVLIVCGSCSPVAANQIDWAVKQGFKQFAMNDMKAAQALSDGRSAIIHTRGTSLPVHDIGRTLGQIVREVLETAKVPRVLVAGGDTSGSIARALDIDSLEMVAELTRGAPVCRARAPGSPADGLEFVFKGGQIGAVDLFTKLERPE